MVRKEPFVGFETRQDVTDPYKHVDKLVKVFVKLTCDLAEKTQLAYWSGLTAIG